MNCKLGDIAKIVVSPMGMNLNKRVEVLEARGMHSQFGPVWKIASAQLGVPLITELGCVTDTCDIPDAWLKPIRDDEPPVDVERSEEIEA